MFGPDQNFGWSSRSGFLGRPDLVVRSAKSDVVFRARQKSTEFNLDIESIVDVVVVVVSWVVVVVVLSLFA